MRQPPHGITYELEEEREQWRRKNAELRKEIGELIRMTTLTERARALGFTLSQKQMYLRLHEGDTSAPPRGVPNE